MKNTHWATSVSICDCKLHFEVKAPNGILVILCIWVCVWEFSEPAAYWLLFLFTLHTTHSSFWAERIMVDCNITGRCLALLTVAPDSREWNNGNKFKSHILTKAERMIANYLRASNGNTPKWTTKINVLWHCLLVF